jgi:hypothetical protein
MGGFVHPQTNGCIRGSGLDAEHREPARVARGGSEQASGQLRQKRYAEAIGYALSFVRGIRRAFPHNELRLELFLLNHRLAAMVNLLQQAFSTKASDPDRVRVHGGQRG